MPGKKKERIRFLGREGEQIVVSVKISTATPREEQELIVIKKEKEEEKTTTKEKGKKRKKKKLSKIKEEKGKKLEEEFKLPSLKILTAGGVDPRELDILKGPYSPPKCDYSKVYITRDGRYIVLDPVVSDELREELEAALTELFFLTESESIARALEDEKALNSLLRELDVRDEVSYLIRRELFGYGVLEPLIRDPDIEDFQVPSVGVPAKALHREYGPLETNIVFEEEDLNRYIEKFVAKTGSSISLYMPLASLQLPEGHRLTVSYSREVTTRGPALVVRKFPEKPWSIAMVMEKNSISPEMAAWLMMLVESKKGIMIVGPMGSGKTSVMNAICNFIPRRATIVTIEDTPELRLSHPYWIQHKTRESLTVEGKGNITMFDLVKHALRESADYMIVGEVRGEEGRIWAQAISTGHGGITTFHAESPEAMIARLTSPPILVEKGLLTALKSIVMTGRLIRKVQEDGKSKPVFYRKVVAIYDYNYDSINGRDEIKLLFRYNPSTDSFEAESDILETSAARLIMTEKGWSTEEFLEEYNKRVKLMRLIKEHVEKARDAGVETPLTDYAEVTKVFWLFSEAPEKAYDYIEEMNKKIQSGFSEPHYTKHPEPGDSEDTRADRKSKIKFID